MPMLLCKKFDEIDFRREDIECIVIEFEPSCFTNILFAIYCMRYGIQSPRVLGYTIRHWRELSEKDLPN